jgi:hypothetical protein
MRLLRDGRISAYVAGLVVTGTHHLDTPPHRRCPAHHPTPTGHTYTSRAGPAP